MPIYEYACRACGHRMEALQKMSDDPLVECPHCQEKSLKKLVSAAAFRLKGGGWYETDFKSGDKKNLAKSEGTASDTKSTKPAGSATDKVTKKDTKSATDSGSSKKTGAKD